MPPGATRKRHYHGKQSRNERERENDPWMVEHDLFANAPKNYLVRKGNLFAPRNTPPQRVRGIKNAPLPQQGERVGEGLLFYKLYRLRFSIRRENSSKVGARWQARK